MRAYLLDFFNEYGYTEKDSQQLLAAYDKITADKSADRLFDEILSAYKADKSKVINVHIPRTGTPLDKESCDKAYAQAREFFKEQVGENCPFVSYSWLLYPENKDILPKDTNTYRFMSEYDIIGWEVNNGEDLWRLFDTEEKNPDRLPCDTTMRRCYVEYLKKGGRVGCGFGVRL